LEGKSMIRRRVLLVIGALLVLCALAAPASAPAAEECTLEPDARCFGVETLEASLSTDQAGAHPDLNFAFGINQDPKSPLNTTGLHDSYAPTRDVQIDLPPGLIGDPNVLGVPQQCTAEELLSFMEAGGGCPNGSQIGVTRIYTALAVVFREPTYMMRPPGGDVVARVGFIAGTLPIFGDIRVRSERDYGLVIDLADTPATARVIRAETTTWGVPADPSHDTERCTVQEAFNGCASSPSRPPGSRPLPFLTNPTRCGAPLSMSVAAASWVEPDRFDKKTASFPEIAGCDNLPFGPSLVVDPTNRAAAQPTGADVTIRLPASDGVNVLEPSQMRDISVKLPEGFAFNPAAGDGLATCSIDQVHFETRLPSECPDAAKLADTEFDIPVLERNLKGAVYLREPEPGNPFRIWITADDLGLHVKLPGQLDVNKQTGQITEVTMNVPQAPVREAKLEFKSGFRAPLVTPQECGEYQTAYEFVPWSGGPSVTGSTPMTIDEGCDTGGFDPKLSAGTTDASAGGHAPFAFTLTRQDGEQNPQGLDIALPAGLAATFVGVSHCEGADAVSGKCPAASKIGHVTAAVGAGPTPLWVPQAGKRPTAVYLGGPYKGAPTSIVAVVPKQAGPFDFGDEAVRSAIYVDPRTGQATAKADPLPQMIEGIPIDYRTLHVDLDRPNFTLNPTGCQAKAVSAAVTSVQGVLVHPSSPFTAVNCAALGFKPSLTLRLRGGIKRGDHPALRATFAPRVGDANAAKIVALLPHSAFLDQAHIRTICTRVQFAAGSGNGAECPAGSIYGHVTAYTPILDEALSGPVFLRSSSHNLPDLVMALHGPASLPIEIEAVGRIDSVKGGIRSSFEAIPDAPLTKVVLAMQGGKKGLIVNSTNLCARANRADVSLTGHNGKGVTAHPELKVKCGRSSKHRRSKRP
jgi:hypothetical protein